MKILPRINNAALHVGVAGCVMLGFAISTSRALFNTASFLIVVGWIFSGNFKEKLKTIRNNNIFWPALGIVMVLVLGAFHTLAPWSVVLEHWDRYSKFLLMLMIISLLVDQCHRRWVWWAFIGGCSVVLVSTYLNIFFILPWSKTKNLGWGVDHSVFIDYIAQSFVVALFAVLLWLRALHANLLVWRIVFFTLCAAALFSITNLTSSRIGYGVVICLAIVIPLLSFSRRWAIFAMFFAISFALGVLHYSDLASTRIQQMFSEIAVYQQGEVLTSTGARLHMWVTAFNLWMQAPWIGHGTGAYHELSKLAFDNEIMCQIGCFHPHNQFLFFAVDHGLVGVILLIAYLVSAVAMALRRSQSEKILFACFVVIIFVAFMAHGPLWLYMEAYFSFGMMALLASGASGLFDVKNG